VVNMSDRTHVYVGFVSFKFRFRHGALASQDFIRKSFYTKPAIGIEPMTSSLPRKCSTI
jgi:hypothetical protein